MTIETKYDIGQTVWLLRVYTRTEKTPCPRCLGTKSREVKWPDGTTDGVICKACGGTGNGWDVLREWKEYFGPFQRVVTGVEYRQGSRPTWDGLIYRLNRGVQREEVGGQEDNSNIFGEENLFATEEEAEMELRRRREE